MNVERRRDITRVVEALKQQNQLAVEGQRQSQRQGQVQNQGQRQLQGQEQVHCHGHGAGPWISASVPGPVRSKLEESFALAVSRVQKEARCGALFARLGHDGVEMLKTTLYYPAELKFEKRVCPNAYAFTVVGGAPTWLCRSFSGLSDKRAALVLLHEALHHAGVGESHDRSDLMSPREIDRLLSESCGF